MSKQLVLTTFKKCFEETISDAFLCGTALNVNSLLQEKNVNYFRGINYVSRKEINLLDTKLNQRDRRRARSAACT